MTWRLVDPTPPPRASQLPPPDPFPVREQHATQVRGGLWCGVGIQQPKRECNVGGLMRSAVCLRADFVFTIGRRYTPEASDTVRSWTHIPCWQFDDFDQFQRRRPFDAPLIGVELTDDAQPLETFRHPRRAVYLLGPEDGSLSRQAQEACAAVVKIDTEFCLNVASAATVLLYDRSSKLARGEYARKVS